MKNISISIIIPTLNEEDNIGPLLKHLLVHKDSVLKEIIVADGGSKDQTVSIAKNARVKVVRCEHCGRAYQMNKGVEASTGDVLYFVHSDTLPPRTYCQDIVASIKEGYAIGCFRATYDSTNILLKINSYGTRFNKLWCRGGDQTLFITRSLFERLGTYQEDCRIMEEYLLIQKAQQIEPFKIIPKNVLVSTRKYDGRGYFKVQIANLVVFNLFRLGVSQNKLVAIYKRLLG